jgi:hypothetical protein
LHVETPRTDSGPDRGSSDGRRRLWRLPAAALGALLAVSVVSGTAAAATANGSGSHAGSAGTAAQFAPKSVPVAPANAAKGTPLVTPKPKLTGKAAAQPLVAWSVTLTASTNSLWPTQYTTLTATTNQNVGPTLFYLSIFPDSGGLPLAICGTGTTCSVAVTQPTAVTLNYVAVISSYPTTSWWNVANIQAVSDRQQIQWKGMQLGLAASQNTAALGGTVTLYAVTDADVGPSPFYIEIFDVTTGTRLVFCATGVTCNASVSQTAATTDRYVAYLAGLGTTLPLPTVQDTTEPVFVTWAATGWSITTTTVDVSGGGTQSVTATASGDVGPTPYYIELFDVDTGARIGLCGTGTACTVAYNTYGHVVAFVSANDTALLPANIQASSNTVETAGPPIS